MKKIVFLSLILLSASAAQSVGSDVIEYLYSAIESCNVGAVKYMLKGHTASDFTDMQKETLLKAAGKAKSSAKRKVSILKSGTDILRLFSWGATSAASFAVAGGALAASHPHIQQSLSDLVTRYGPRKSLLNSHMSVDQAVSKFRDVLSNITNEFSPRPKPKAKRFMSRLETEIFEVADALIGDVVADSNNMSPFDRFMAMFRRDVVPAAAPIIGVCGLVGCIGLYKTYKAWTLSYAKEQHKKARIIYAELESFIAHT